MEAENVWPLKIAVLDYVNQALMDTNDQQFLKPKKEDNEEYGEEEKEDEGETEVQTLLKIVENLNEDFERYLKDEIVDHQILLPTGRNYSALESVE